jgi:hypothetical protein
MIKGVGVKPRFLLNCYQFKKVIAKKSKNITFPLRYCNNKYIPNCNYGNESALSNLKQIQYKINLFFQC